MNQPSQKRRKIKPLWWFGLFALLGLALFLYQLFGPNPGIVISKQTTYITAPLAEDGLPDFEAYLLKRGFEGVTPENNAAVLIWQALWPGVLSPEHQLLMLEALGMEEVPSQAKSLKSFDDVTLREQLAEWLEEKWSKPEEMDDATWQDQLRNTTVQQVIDEAKCRPWTSKEIPALAQWVQDNQGPLDLLVEASKRSHFFSPSPNHLDGSQERLISSLLPMAQSMRTAVRALNLRAMWHLGEGRHEKAWQDLQASFQLAQFVANGWIFVQGLVGIAIEHLTADQLVVLLHHGNLSPEYAQKILQELQALPVLPRMAEKLDHGERLALIDSTLALATGRNKDMDSVGGPLSMLVLDWNFVLRETNQFYDRMVAGVRLPTRKERLQAFAAIEQELGNRSANVKNRTTQFGTIFSRRRRSETIADVMLALMTPAVQAALSAQDRSAVKRQLAQLAAALAVYRGREGAYPEQLADLVPEILPKLPLDLYSGKPFIYQRKDDGGYLLYSVFEDETDDGGTNLEQGIVKGEWAESDSEEGVEEPLGEDIVIRVPVPKFKLPEPPTVDEGLSDFYGEN
ncbi:MAG: hypothetical protein MI725_11540 [Pirellulales bacterium]|nr:hypothetical protein [Pirellulales bacterium]